MIDVPQSQDRLVLTKDATVSSRGLRIDRADISEQETCGNHHTSRPEGLPETFEQLAEHY
jgi:hypothetical protein